MVPLSSRRSSLSESDGPPPFYLRGPPPPSFRSSPPTSVIFQNQSASDDVSRVFVADDAGNVFTTPRKPSEKLKLKPSKVTQPKPLEPIEEKWKDFGGSQPDVVKPEPVAEKMEPTIVIQSAAAIPEPPRSRTPSVKHITRNICSGNIFVCCVGNRNPWCLAAVFVGALLVGAAIVLGTLLPRALRNHHDVPFNAANISSITTVSSAITVSLTTTTTVATTQTTTSTFSSSTPTPTPSKASEEYLGGFDAVAITPNSAKMFYTDQEGGLQVIYTDTSGTWNRDSPATIASDVQPGSPVSASKLGDIVHVFYVDVNNTIQGLSSSLPNVLSTTTMSNIGNNFTPHPVSLLGLKTSDTLFIRTCVTSNNSLDHIGSMYLYFIDKENVVNKYVFTNDSTGGYVREYDLPNLAGVREVECQFAGGVETLWTLNANGASPLMSWYRDAMAKGEWTQGFISQDAAFSASSILSMSDSSSRRTHIIFQNAQQHIQQYDFDGFGASQNLSGNTIHSVVTPGTRLTTWANSGWCGESVSLYYQMSNTSALYYSSFSDQASSAPSYSYSPTRVVTYSSQDILMPLVETYGRKVKAAGKKKSGKLVKKIFMIIGIILGACLLCCCL